VSRVVKFSGSAAIVFLKFRASALIAFRAGAGSCAALSLIGSSSRIGTSNPTPSLREERNLPAFTVTLLGSMGQVNNTAHVCCR